MTMNFQPKTRTSPKNLLEKVWGQLTTPSAAITEIGEQRSARLAASFLFIISCFNLIGVLVRSTRLGIIGAFSGPIGISFIAVLTAYLLARTKWYRVAIFLFALGFSALPYQSMISQGADANVGTLLFIYVPISLIVASSFLSPWAVLLLTFFNVSALYATRFFGAPIPEDLAPITGLIIVVGLVLIALNNFRNNLEKDRLKELQSANQNLEDLTTNLEERVNERTLELETLNRQTFRRVAQLQAITELSESIGKLQDLNELFSSATSLISERFGVYHVGIFLLDIEKQYALLQATNSEGGKRMLERGHRLKLGIGVVGYVARAGQPRIALDVGADAVFFDNPDLPKTRSEVALPLKTRGETIGVLDVQSTEPGVFSNEDLQVLTTLANQVSIALENTRLLTETRTALRQVEEVYNEFTRAEWSRAVAKAEQAGFRYQTGRVEIIENPLSNHELVSAARTGLVTHSQTNGSQAKRPTVAVPVKLRGEVIGILQIESNDPSKSWQTDEISLVEAVAERAAFALENARLFQDARRRAAKERLISEAATRISGASNIENILQTTAQELERVLGGSEVLIRFQNKEQS